MTVTVRRMNAQDAEAILRIDENGQSQLVPANEYKGMRTYALVEKLLANVVSPETTDWHYNTHHKGYVTALNNIEKGLETADRAAAVIAVGIAAGHFFR